MEEQEHMEEDEESLEEEEPIEDDEPVEDEADMEEGIKIPELDDEAHHYSPYSSENIIWIGVLFYFYFIYLLQF